MAEILNLYSNLNNPEGFTGGKKTFQEDPWLNLFAARQNKNTILTGTIGGIEEYQLGEKKVVCAVIFLGSVKGIVPISESGCKTKAQLRKLVGQIVSFKVLQLDEENNLFIGSREKALEQMAEYTWENIKKGQVRTAVVRDVKPRAALVDIGGITVELPASEVSWGWVSNMKDYLQIGDAFDVKVTEVDKGKKEIKISLKQLLKNPWPEVTKRYSVGMEKMARVSGIERYGLFVELEPGVNCLCYQKESSVRPAVGETVLVKIYAIEPDSQHIKGSILRRIKVR